MAISGWLTLKEAERYTRAVDQKKLAARAMVRAMGRMVPIKNRKCLTLRVGLSNPIDMYGFSK